jgi:ribonuclease HI
MTKWCSSWQRNGWYNKRGLPVVNRPQIEELLDAMQGMQIQWVCINYLFNYISFSLNIFIFIIS